MSCSKEIKKIPNHPLQKTNGSPQLSEKRKGCSNEKMNGTGIRLPTRILCVRHMLCLNRSVLIVIDICCRVTAFVTMSFSESESDFPLEQIRMQDTNHFTVSKGLVQVLGTQKKDLALAVTQNGHRLRQEHMKL